VLSLSLREHQARAAEIYQRLRGESPYSQMHPKSFKPLVWADPEAKEKKKGANISSAQECRRQSQDSDRLDAAAAAAGPQMHALGSVLRAPMLRLLELALQHEVQLREVAEDASVPPHTGLSVSIVPKTSTGRLRKGYASPLKGSVAKELLALQGFIAEMLAARLPGFDRERMYDTMYDSSRDDPGTLQPVRQNRTKAVISLTDTAGGGYIRLSPLSAPYLAKEGKKFDRERKEAAGEAVLYNCAGEDGTAMSVTASENTGTLHGWEGADDGASCVDHQDWMSWQTVVVAFAISRGGVRVMVQITFRVACGQAQAAAAILREHLFGDAQEAVVQVDQ
jgi:hypothetical protein